MRESIERGRETDRQTCRQTDRARQRERKRERDGDTERCESDTTCQPQPHVTLVMPLWA